MISVFLVHTLSGQCASVATARRPYRYDLHFSQVSCVNARFPPISQSAQSVSLEKAIRLTNAVTSPTIAPSAASTAAGRLPSTLHAASLAVAPRPLVIARCFVAYPHASQASTGNNPMFINRLVRRLSEPSDPRAFLPNGPVPLLHPDSGLHRRRVRSLAFV
jgi:hypothetical protein